MEVLLYLFAFHHVSKGHNFCDCLLRRSSSKMESAVKEFASRGPNYFHFKR